VELVLRSIEDMQGGETFVPRIPSMRMSNLARVYPKIDGIPCPRSDDGIIASAMDTRRGD
jgi:FlaA1/EpsC-like NDP-sugar epimerase